MRLDDVLDAQAGSRGLVQVLIDVPLRIDHCRFASIPNEIGSMRKAAEIELFEVHG